MQLHIDPVTAGLIKERFAALGPAMQKRIEPMLAKANAAAVAVSQQKTSAAYDPSIAHQALLAGSVLSNDKDDVLKNLSPGLVIDVTDGGEILGTGKYQLLDPGWVESVAAWLGTLLVGPHAFNSTPKVTPIDDVVTIALAGDWGTGDYRGDGAAPSAKVGSQIAALAPDITIHLGDVYYAGTNDEEQQLLVKLWPRGKKGTFALNSNHEMYSGAKPYFNDTLANADFKLQQGASCFALENQNWVIVGLDSAYYSDAAGLYRTGRLQAPGGPSTQLDFLRAQAAKGKKTIVLTHHNGLSQDGSAAEPIWNEVLGAFPVNAGPDYWYWGHVHSGAIYMPLSPATVQARCCGHGALPCGASSDLAKSTHVAWFEHGDAHDADIKERVLNGFAVLRLNGASIQETFYDENGAVSKQV